jgi:hypothetical protein
MMSRPSSVALIVLGLLIAAAAAILLDAAYLRDERMSDLAATRTLAARLQLTDIALVTEARYTRHPSQADLHSAFQDHPLASEHFPSGSFIAPRPNTYEHLAGEAATSD